MVDDDINVLAVEPHGKRGTQCFDHAFAGIDFEGPLFVGGNVKMRFTAYQGYFTLVIAVANGDLAVGVELQG